MKPAILHIDDESDFLDLFLLSFNKYFDITGVSNFSSAWEKLNTCKFDAIVTDYDIQEHNAVTFLKLMQERHPHIPIIFLTGQGNDQVARDAFTSGAVDYFTKDLMGFANKEKIINSINNAINKVRIENEFKKTLQTNTMLMSNLQGMAYRCHSDKNWTMTFVSEGCFELTGYYPEDLIQNKRVSYNDLIHPEDRDSIRKTVLEKLAVNKPFQAEYRIITAAKDEKWVWEKGRGVFSPMGDLLLLEGFITDITDRKTIEDKIEWVSRFPSENPNPILRIDEKGLLLYANTSSAYLLNEWNCKQGKYIPDEIIKKVLDTMEAKANPLFFEINAGELTYIARLAPILDKGYINLYCTDVTHLKKAEARIHHLNLTQQAIRNINQLIIKEKNVPGLIQKLCDTLTETRGYVSACIILTDQQGRYLSAGESDIGKETHQLKKILENNTYPGCISNAFNTNKLLVLNSNDNDLCRNCFNRQEHSSIIRYFTRLEHDEKVFGVIGAAIPDNIPLIAEEEEALFLEIAKDVSYALYNIEMGKIKTQSEEQAFKERNLRSSLFQYMPFGCVYNRIIFDQNQSPIDAKILEVNNAFESITGIKTKNVLNKSIIEIFNSLEDHNNNWIKTIITSASDGTQKPIERYIPAINKWVSVLAFCPEAEHIVIFIDDITEQKQLEANLKRESELLAKIMENSPAGIITMVNKEGRIVYANKKAEEILSLSKNDILERTYNSPKWRITDYEGNLINSDQLPFKIVKRTGKPAYDIKHAITNKSGEKILLNINSVPIFDESGNFDGLISRVEDVAKLLDSQQELLEKNRELQDFAYMVSHELKTPLSIISGFLKAIKDNPVLFDKYFNQLVSQSDRLISFVDNLLKLSRAGKIISDKKTINLNAMIRNIVKENKSEAAPVNLVFDSQLPHIKGDPQKLNLVFTNLIKNAMQNKNPLKEHLTINVSHQLKKDKIVIRLQDDGSGIQSKVINKIFDAGFSSKKSEGGGFGLTISKKIIEAHKGRIWAKSDGKNCGTTFYIELPI